MIPWRRKRKYRVYRTETVYFPVNGITRSFELKKQRVCDVWAKTAREAIRESQIRYVYLLCYRPDIRVTCVAKNGNRSVNRAYIDEQGFFHGSGSMAGVVAWQPMPEPYAGGDC